MAIGSGDRLGRYEILGQIGAGGMGEVWRARDTELGREVAIKVLTPDVANSPERRKRFGREARAIAGLNHPNLLTIHDVGIDDGQPFIVTELLEGESLRRNLRRSLPSHATAVKWGLAIAHGLAAAHAKAVVHRDVKPDNVFLTTNNRVKILDFSLAKILETNLGEENKTGALSTESDITSGAVLGTMGFMAPEQMRGDPVDIRTDVFSFGCVLYEMLTGRRPFAGRSSAERWKVAPRRWKKSFRRPTSKSTA
jgi:serine/threonine protein kinase